MWVKFADGYEASENGQIRSIKRVITRSNGRPHLIRERILRPAKDKSGYLRVGLMISNKLKTYKVHRIIADCFCKKVDGFNEVNHIDGNKANNCKENLEWSNRSLNVYHAYSIGLSKPKRGSENSSSKIDEMKALTIMTLLDSGHGPAKISKLYKISLNICKDISRKRTWKHLL